MIEGEHARLASCSDATGDELVAAARRGDDAAFAELYRRYRPDVLVVCTRLVGREHAEDLTQETFARVYARLHTFRAGMPVWPWLRRVARNVCIDDLRVRGGVPTISLVDEPATDDGIRAADRRLMIVDALRRLPDRERRFIWLREVEDLPYEEIAVANGSTVHAVRNASWRARAFLRAALRDVRSFVPAFILATLEVVRGGARRARDRFHALHIEAAGLTRGFEGAVLLALTLSHPVAPAAPAPPLFESPIAVAIPHEAGAVSIAAQAADHGASGRWTGRHIDGRRPPGRDLDGDVRVDKEWTKDALTPGRARGRVEVTGPDGSTLFWYEVGRDTCTEDSDARLPGGTRARSYC